VESRITNKLPFWAGVLSSPIQMFLLNGVIPQYESSDDLVEKLLLLPFWKDKVLAFDRFYPRQAQRA